jgi:AbrB family looped-hinge helix DNA binding protein
VSDQVILEPAVATTVTVKGQVTLPKKVRDAAGIKPGDRVEVRATPSGAVIIEKPNARIDKLQGPRLCAGKTQADPRHYNR